MDPRLKRFIICALSAGIGTLIALSVHPFFWWLGMIAGGGVAYVCCVYRKIIPACKQAWQWVYQHPPDWQKIVNGFWISLAFIGFFSSIIIAAIAITEISELLSLSELTAIISAVFVAIIMSVAFLQIMVWEDKGKISLPKIAWLTSPICILVYWPIYSFVLLFRFLKEHSSAILQKVVKEKIPSMLKFIKLVLVQMHTEEALSCLFYAALGSAIGFFAGSVLIGALSGGVFAVIFYEVVTKRILHLNGA